MGALTPSDDTHRMRDASVKILSRPEVAISPQVVASRLADMMLFLRHRKQQRFGKIYIYVYEREREIVPESLLKLALKYYSNTKLTVKVKVITTVYLVSEY